MTDAISACSGASEVKLAIFTLAYNAEPYIERHLLMFNQLRSDWRWIVVHGAAMNNGSTGWCAKQKPRLSTDGTTEYLRSIKCENVTVLEKKSWPSKDAMVNAALEQIKEPCVLMETDSDELHTTANLSKIVELFANDPQLGAIRIPCRFWVGEKLVCQGENCWSNQAWEYERAWRFKPGMKFASHEPPRIDHLGRVMQRVEARSHGLTFEHYAYATEAQIRYKSKFYKYGESIVEAWRKLQSHQHFPVELSRFFHWLDDPNWPKVVRA